LDASIAIAEGTYNASDLLVISANKSILNYTPAPGKIGVLYIKKFLHLPHAAANNADDNWPVYRYADALLLLAEAQNEQGEISLLCTQCRKNKGRLTCCNCRKAGKIPSYIYRRFIQGHYTMPDCMIIV
jgi:hypothetical protein